MGVSRNAGVDNPMFGRKHSAEALAKMSAAHKGKKRPPRTSEWCQHLAESLRGTAVGPDNPAWNGGRRIDHGYILVYQPNHPFANRQGYVYEHRLVMEKKLGRYLEPAECPHHKNEDRSDNDPNNLELYPSHGIHMATCHVVQNEHGRFVGKKAIGPLDDKVYHEFPT